MRGAADHAHDDGGLVETFWISADEGGGGDGDAEVGKCGDEFNVSDRGAAIVVQCSDSEFAVVEESAEGGTVSGGGV